MKKSKAVPLLLLGSTAVLTACTPDIADQQPQQQVEETRQDVYTTMEECDLDWDDDECEDRGGLYLGPRYFYVHGARTPYLIDRKGRSYAVPSHYGAYKSHRASASGTPAVAPGRSTVVTRNVAAISRGGFGGGRSSGSFGG